MYDGFCIQGRLLPSVFVIGIAKCGTSTFDMIVQQFPELSHGTKKEHVFYPLISKKLEKFIDSVVESCAKQFPKWSTDDQKLQTHKTIINYDALGGYAFPSYRSVENIKRFYKYLGIPLRKLLFISMVCPNTLRVPSCFYYSLVYMVHKAKEEHKPLDVRKTKLNVCLSNKLVTITTRVNIKKN